VERPIEKHRDLGSSGTIKRGATGKYRGERRDKEGFFKQTKKTRDEKLRKWSNSAERAGLGEKKRAVDEVHAPLLGSWCVTTGEKK